MECPYHARLCARVVMPVKNARNRATLYATERYPMEPGGRSRSRGRSVASRAVPSQLPAAAVTVQPPVALAEAPAPGAVHVSTPAADTAVAFVKHMARHPTEK